MKIYLYCAQTVITDYYSEIEIDTNDYPQGMRFLNEDLELSEIEDNEGKSLYLKLDWKEADGEVESLRIIEVEEVTDTK